MPEHPYRDTLSGLMARRSQLIRELEELDQRIDHRAYDLIPCYKGLSGLQRWKLRRAWKVIEKLGPWSDSCCEMETWDPCPERHAGRSCGFVDEMITPQLQVRQAERAGHPFPRPDPPAAMRPGPPTSDG